MSRAFSKFSKIMAWRRISPCHSVLWLAVNHIVIDNFCGSATDFIFLIPLVVIFSIFGQNQRQTQCSCGFIALGVIIPHSSILLTIPVAFIYKNSFVDLITLLLSVNKGVLYLSVRIIKLLFLLQKFYNHQKRLF